MSSFDTESRTAWISKGFEHLAAEVSAAPDNKVHFEVLIIGSGYGGAVAVATLAGRSKGGPPIRIGVLERGNEYLPGSFPTGLAELPTYLRRDGNRQGLFDVRLGPKVNVVVANGLGGGSLINAGVMETPSPERFQSGWPAELSTLTTWQNFYDEAAEMLGARIGGVPNQIDKHPDGPLDKHQALKNMAPSHFRSAEITVAMSDRTNGANVRLKKCVRCGDCATGCNFGAKESLDLGLLVQAHQAGAEIYCGGTVLHVSQDGDNWVANAVFTDKNLRLREHSVTRIRASKIIIAAGTMGSNEILARSHENGLSLSGHMLGKRCSTNGDMLAADFSTNSEINTVADEAVQPSTRSIGPTITGVIDLREVKGVLIQEISVPASLRVVFGEVFGTVNALHSLQDIDWSSHATGFPGDDGYAIPPQSIKQTAVFAIMGDDGAQGEIDVGDTSKNFEVDGTARMLWPADEPATFVNGVDTLSNLTNGSGGRFIANPAWRLLPEDLSFLTGGQRGPVTTVHPLGGLVMADHGSDGVVNPTGQVFKSDNAPDAYEGLVVLDGSIVPTALGTNPALTIAALALRSARHLAAFWGYDPAQPPAPQPQPFERPVFRETDQAVEPKPTEVEVIERLYGPVRFSPQGKPPGRFVVELTMRFEPKPVQTLNPGQPGLPVLDVSTSTDERSIQSEIRVFDKDEWDELARKWDPPTVRELKLDAMAKFRAPLSGTLKVLEREDSWFLGRIWRAGRAWFWNRGLRDVYQAVFDGSSGPPGSGLLSRIKSGIAIASRAGEVRRFVYDLQIGIVAPGGDFTLSGSRIRGVKRFTYNRRGNPWRQLMEIELDVFPGIDTAQPRVLKLDTAYLARIGVPLFRIVKQADSVKAITDLGGFLGYFLRLLLGIHIWSFRAPDEWPSEPQVEFEPPAELELSDGITVTAQPHFDEGAIQPEKPALSASNELVEGRVRITRYPQANITKRPVVMFHGYSAGGTTFAHKAVNPNLASHLYESGRDVMIADMRTSPYFEQTAKQPWAFEQIAKQDVHWVINKALELTGAQKVDVVAHCMGTIVVSQAILDSAKGTPPADALFKKIGRMAFTQVGPVVVFSPINILRGYVMRYLVEFLPDAYEFRPENPTLADDLWDRVVATLPYPVEEFDIENPILPWKRTPWTRTRHRMDALYGRDFSAARMEDGVLNHIDDHFGALSLRTVASTLHFARHDLMTDHRGSNTLVSRDLLEKGLEEIPILSVHGSDNGLSDVATVDRMEQILHDAGVQYLAPKIIEGAGHQDCLIGADRLETFENIRTFLDADVGQNDHVRNDERVAYPPWIGPVMTLEEPDNATEEGYIARIGAAPSHRKPEGVVLLRVHVSGNSILKPDQTGPWTKNDILDSMAVYRSDQLEQNLWDAFEIPAADVMPNHDPANPGNATLILIVYDEARVLAPVVAARYYMLENRQTLKEFDRTGKRSDVVSREITLESFQAMRDAVSDALARRLSMERPEGEKPDKGKNYKGLRTVNRLMIDPAAATGMRQQAVTEMQFGPDTVFGTAALESLRDQSFDLHDGIVPDRKPPIGAETTRFMFGSCQYPAGLFDGPTAYRSYAGLAHRLRGPAATAPRFMLFVGDQIYSDATAGVFDPRDQDDRYRTPYENWLRANPVRTALRSGPSYMLLDDHELVDNWEPSGQPPATWFGTAVEAYEKYQHGLRANRVEFGFDGFPFFLLDTRRFRNRRQVNNLSGAKLFDANDPMNTTMNELKAFLSGHDGPKFVITPSLFLPRHRRAVQRDTSLDPTNLSAIHSDGWDGYLATMQEVLLYIAKNEISHVVFLSGDEHRACFATVDLSETNGNHVARFVSVHTSALWAPFPFANGKAEDTVDHETFTVSDNVDQFTCSVTTDRPAPDDGPTYIYVGRNGQDWRLEVEYADGTTQSTILN
ncbi:alpha/beta fold hydrolase [Ruegeria sp. HKCCA6837]|uniref:alpha/beta fold hydrolase n=1 Tax=Ruegeria sp. HKCCA6837 TaxID=2682989 RepID=UPI00148897A2|nr:alpha/beta fold hydrolase [Ruegeria sp. HKCCA6837]